MKKISEKTILFVCTGNACRSQMAEGFARHLFPDGWRVLSAGTIAAGVHETAKTVMKEEGIDISDQYSKTLDDIPLNEIDYVVTLCGDARDRCPHFPNAAGKEHWPIADPVYSTGTPEELPTFRAARDDILGRMQELVEKLA
jgi:arsenate reductase